MYSILLVVCVSASLVQADESYGDLAIKMPPTYYEKMLEILPSLTNASEPDGVRALRHNISDVRNLLDIFAFAFPNNTHEGKDVWPKLRGDLDNGYTLIGDFQDLSHSGVNYTVHDRQERLTPCLKWRTTFESHMAKYNYSQFIKSAHSSQLFYRRDKVYSKDFWEYIGVSPEPGLTGLQNMAVLERGIVGQLADNYTRVVALDDIWNIEDHILFHDFRKLFRSANTVSGYFGAVFNKNSSCEVARGINDFTQAYNKFGDLNDEVTAYQFYKQHHKTRLAALKKISIITDWGALKTWMALEDMPQLFSCLLNSTVA